MSERETWSTDEFGALHTGEVGVLLADGTVPRPVIFDTSSSGAAHSVSHWSVYDGTLRAPRAHAVRGVCSCGWTGPERLLEWDETDDPKLDRARVNVAIHCESDWWDMHLVEVEASAVPLPETITDLLSRLGEEIEKLGHTQPLAAVRAARKLEITAGDVALWPARNAWNDNSTVQIAAALGLNEADARHLLHRYSRYSRHNRYT
ncbi:hypothetical protein ACFV4F_42210 [Kitasatospora sp. NPDC059722]|uniref:hypothetical protein n=1 Tax=Kitasatospora sp. NPDC059722 TaxID=3346925 RepID=UPI0036905380